MANAKEEFLSITEGRSVLCAHIEFEYDWNEPRKKISLKCGYGEEEWEAFLQQLDFEYYHGYGGQELFGTIWFTDGTWAERGEYDGSEWWEIRQLPEIPDHLKQ